MYSWSHCQVLKFWSTWCSVLIAKVVCRDCTNQCWGKGGNSSLWMQRYFEVGFFVCFCLDFGFGFFLVGRKRKKYSSSGASSFNLGCKLCKLLKYCSLNKQINFRACDRAAFLNRSVFSVYYFPGLRNRVVIILWIFSNCLCYQKKQVRNFSTYIYDIYIWFLTITLCIYF